MKKTIVSFLTLIIIAGCTTVKRFKHAKTEAAGKQYVTMSLFSARSEEKKEEKDNSKTLWDLDAEGQAALIDKLDKRQVDNEKFLPALSNKYLEEDNRAASKDYCIKNLKFVLSVSKLRDYSNFPKTFTTADRIEYLKFKLKLQKGQNAEFIKWDKFQTEFATIDIADVTFDRSLEASLTAKGEIGATAKMGDNEAKANLSGEANIKGSISKKEAQKIKYRYASLNGALNKDYLLVEEEGTREIDLNGNIVIEATIKFKSVPGKFILLDDLRDKAGNYNSPDKLSIRVQNYTMPDFPNGSNLKVDLDYLYVYRFAKAGYKTFPEYDDRIVFKTGTAENNGIDLILQDDIKPGIWSVGYDNPSVDADANIPLKLKDSFGIISDLQFSSPKQATDFMEWLLSFPCANSCLSKNILIGKSILLDSNKNPIQRKNLTIANTNYFKF